MWSSPISAMTPPCGEVPARLAWRNTSPLRSTPGPLPYQSPNTPSKRPSPAHLRLLRAPDRGRRELLVEAGLEMDVVGLEELLQPRELQIEPADRRAAIAGDEAAGVEPGAAVALLLGDQQPRDGLRARQQHRRFRQVVAVGELDFIKSAFGDVRGVLVHSRFPPVADRPRSTRRQSAADRRRMCSELARETSRPRRFAFSRVRA